jgi:hypothetical protein
VGLVLSFATVSVAELFLYHLDVSPNSTQKVELRNMLLAFNKNMKEQKFFFFVKMFVLKSLG